MEIFFVVVRIVSCKTTYINLCRKTQPRDTYFPKFGCIQWTFPQNNLDLLYMFVQCLKPSMSSCVLIAWAPLSLRITSYMPLRHTYILCQGWKKWQKRKSAVELNFKKKKKKKYQSFGLLSCSDLVVRQYFESTILTGIFHDLTWIKWEKDTEQGFAGDIMSRASTSHGNTGKLVGRQHFQDYLSSHRWGARHWPPGGLLVKAPWRCNRGEAAWICQRNVKKYYQGVCALQTSWSEPEALQPNVGLGLLIQRVICSLDGTRHSRRHCRRDRQPGPVWKAVTAATSTVG